MARNCPTNRRPYARLIVAYADEIVIFVQKRMPVG